MSSEGNSYSVEYAGFDEAISVTNSLKDTVSSTKEKVTSCKSNLNSDMVFAGPICNSCMDAFLDVDAEISAVIGNCTSVSKSLRSVSETYKDSDFQAANSFLQADGELNLDGNVIVVDQPVAQGNKYNLSDDDLVWLGNVALHEQGSLEGAKMELSLMANLYEQHKDEGYSSVRDYVERSGWFSGSAMTGEFPGEKYVDAANEVLNEGNLYLTPDINEHNSMRSVDYITTGDASNRDDYIPGETIVYNKMGAVFRFEGFAPYDGDPFGVEISDQL